jgi:hypothetical protein
MILFGISAPFGSNLAVATLFRSLRYVTYLLLTLPPLTILSIAQLDNPFDLHVLATPPAFILSQDQTLQLIHRTILRWDSSKLKLVGCFYEQYQQKNS